MAPGTMAPVVVRVKSDASTPVTDLLKVTVKSTVAALVGLVLARVIDDTVGGARTIRFALLLAGPAIDVCVVVTPEVALGLLPSVLLLTANVTVQVPPLPVPGIVIPLKLRAMTLAPSEFPKVPTHL